MARRRRREGAVERRGSTGPAGRRRQRVARKDKKQEGEEKTRAYRARETRIQTRGSVESSGRRKGRRRLVEKMDVTHRVGRRKTRRTERPNDDCVTQGRGSTSFGRLVLRSTRSDHRRPRRPVAFGRVARVRSAFAAVRAWPRRDWRGGSANRRRRRDNFKRSRDRSTSLLEPLRKISPVSRR